MNIRCPTRLDGGTQSAKNAAISGDPVTNGAPWGTDTVWLGRRIIWKEPATWVPPVTAWLAQSLRRDAKRRLKPGLARDITCDDPEWLALLTRCIEGDLDEMTGGLSDALLGATVRTYHGCRTEDAGSYFREGLLVHRQARLKAQAAAIIEAHPVLHYMKEQLDDLAKEISADIDEGKAYVVVSDEALLSDSAHYLIHGSEQIMSWFDEPGRALLRTIGVPTMIEIDLPLEATHSSDRRAFAEHLLQEWTRLACNGDDWVAPINFTFFLIRNVPPAWIVGHYHPASMTNPHDGMRLYHSPARVCKHCAPQLGQP